MADATGRSSVLAKLGNRAKEVLANHATKEPEIPGMGLPAGIDNGIAQVVECKFGVVEAGKPKAGATFFMCQGVVKEPQQFKGVTVAGRRTMIYKEVANAKGEINEKNMEWAQDQLKILVGKNADPKMFLLENLEGTAALIRKAKPHTLFKTYKFDKQDVRQIDGKWFLCNLTEDGSVKGKVNIGGKEKGPYSTEQAARAANPYAGSEPMIQQTWCGATKYIAPSANGTVQDDSPPANTAEESSTPTGHDDAEPTDTSGDSFNEFNESSTETADDVDLDALAAAAYESAEAQQQLNEIAINAGVDPDAVANSERWEDVVEMIRAQGTEGSTESEEESAEEAWTPAKGEVCYYYPKQPNGKAVIGKNKKPVRTEVVILTSDKKSSTCTVQDNDTKKPIIGTNKKPLPVKWDDLAVE